MTKTGRKNKSTELPIQKGCAAYLDAFLDETRASWWHVRNERVKSPREGSLAKKTGQKRGVYDIHILYNDFVNGELTRPKYVIIEVKAPGKGLSKNQKQWRAGVVRLGAVDGGIVTSVDELRERLQSIMPDAIKSFFQHRQAGERIQPLSYGVHDG